LKYTIDTAVVLSTGCKYKLGMEMVEYKTSYW